MPTNCAKFKSFCDKQIRVAKNQRGYDCLTHQLEGHNCICGYTPENIQFDEKGVFISSQGRDLGECKDYEFPKRIAKKLKKLSNERKVETLVKLANS